MWKNFLNNGYENVTIGSLHYSLPPYFLQAEFLFAASGAV
jgi:hypothetical protein